MGDYAYAGNTWIIFFGPVQFRLASSAPKLARLLQMTLSYRRKR